MTHVGAMIDASSAQQYQAVKKKNQKISMQESRQRFSLGSNHHFVFLQWRHSLPD